MLVTSNHSSLRRVSLARSVAASIAASMPSEDAPTISVTR